MSSSGVDRLRAPPFRPAPLSEPCDFGSLGWKEGPVVEDLKNDEIGPKPAGECTRIIRIELCGSKSVTRPPHGVTYIFVQGKESACIVSRNSGKEKKIHDLRFDLFGLTAIRYRRVSVNGHTSEQPPDMDPFAVVSALLNTDDPSEEKESKPDSSLKDSSSRPVNEQAAINFLRQKLENNDTYDETIQTAISALQCLYQEKLNASEIEGFTVQPGWIVRYLAREDIQLHLAVINKDFA